MQSCLGVDFHLPDYSRYRTCAQNHLFLGKSHFACAAWDRLVPYAAFPDGKHQVTLAIYSDRNLKEVHLAISVGECPGQFGHFAGSRRTEREYAWRIPCDWGQTLRFPQVRWEPREFPRLAGGGGGIRTHETLSGLTVFKTAGVNRFPTPPFFLC
jgi:hypothetical protein